MDSFLLSGFLRASKISLFGAGGIVELNEYSSFLKDLKAQTAEVSSLCNFSGPCRWDPFSGCALRHPIQLMNLQKRLRVWDPRSELYVITVLCVVRTLPLLRSKNCFWPYDFVFLNTKNYIWVSHAKNRSAEKGLRRCPHFSRAGIFKIPEVGKYYNIKMLEARRVYHNHKKLIPDFNNLIKEALTLIY